MASELTLRLCHINEEDGGLPNAGLHREHPDYDPSTAHIPIAGFHQGTGDVLGGYHTLQQFYDNYSMDATQQAQAAIIVGKVTDVADLDKRQGRLGRIYSILNKWQNRHDFPLTGYLTPDEVEVKLLAIDTGYL